MPIFEYACNHCQHRFEALLRRAEQEVSCPDCQSPDLRKLFSSFSSTVAGHSQPESCPPGGCGSCASPGFCSMN